MASYKYYFTFLKLFVIWKPKRRKIMKYLFLAATDFELDTARRVWQDADAEFCVSGWGAEATLQTLEAAFATGTPFDGIVDVGIAGSGTTRLPLGAVAHVVAEHHGDRQGTWLHNPAPWPALDFLPKATGRTLQELDARWRAEAADIESMEGAAFFEFCLRHGIPFAEIRAISNTVGETDRSRWDIPLALRNLQTALETFKNGLK